MSDGEIVSDHPLARIVRDKQTRLLALYETTWPHAFEDLDRVHRTDIVYTSNALDGNALTAAETATILEKGFAIGGKSLTDHMQVLDHAHALETFQEIALEDNHRDKHRPVSRGDLDLMNYLLTRRTRWGEGPYHIQQTEDEDPTKGHEPPQTVVDLCKTLRSQRDTPEKAIFAHNRLLEISPFIVGNGRTARLLMNYILMRGGYPPVSVRPDDNPAYSEAVENGKRSGVEAIVFRRLDDVLDLYIAAADQAIEYKKNAREP